jgi:hypothetical protein
MPENEFHYPSNREKAQRAADVFNERAKVAELGILDDEDEVIFLLTDSRAAWSRGLAEGMADDAAVVAGPRLRCAS